MIKYKIVFFFVLFGPPQIIYSQKNNKINWIKENTYELTNIEPSQYLDSELSFLKEVIGDKRIVFLGEDSHGDGVTFLAKSKIIKYLHQEMGFEVLLLEGGFYEMNRAWRDLVEKKDSPTIVFVNLMDVLRYFVSRNYLDLYTYIGDQAFSNKPLLIGGIDIFESSTYYWGIEKDLELLLRRVYGDFEGTEIEKLYLNIVTTYDVKYRIPKGFREKKKNSTILLIDKLQTALNEKNDLEEQEQKQCLFLIQELKNRYNLLTWADLKPKMSKKKGNVLADYYTLRDQYMAENLLWYIEQFYPDKKIIVSASTYHLSRNLEKIKPRPYYLGKDAIPMGHYIWQKHKDEIYSIAFLSHHGYRGIETKTEFTKLKKVKKGSLEGLMHKAGIQYGFLDFSQYHMKDTWLKDIYMSPTYDKAYKTDWTQIYDGIFFIDEMKPDTMYHFFNERKKQPPYSPEHSASPNDKNK